MLSQRENGAFNDDWLQCHFTTYHSLTMSHTHTASMLMRMLACGSHDFYHEEWFKKKKVGVCVRERKKWISFGAKVADAQSIILPLTDFIFIIIHPILFYPEAWFQRIFDDEKREWLNKFSHELNGENLGKRWWEQNSLRATKNKSEIQNKH